MRQPNEKSERNHWFLLCRGKHVLYGVEEIAEKLAMEKDFPSRRPFGRRTDEHFLFDLGTLEDHHIIQVIRPGILRAMRRLAVYYYLAYPHDGRDAVVMLSNVVANDMENWSYDLFFLRKEELHDEWYAGLGVDRKYYEDEPDEERERRQNRNRRILYLTGYDKDIHVLSRAYDLHLAVFDSGESSAESERLRQQQEHLSLLNNLLEPLDEEDIYMSSPSANIYRRICDNVRDIEMYRPVLAVLVNAVLDGSNLCQQYGIEYCLDFPGREYDKVRMEYGDGGSCGEITVTGDGGDPGETVISWESNRFCMFDRIRSGHLTYAESFHAQTLEGVMKDEIFRMIIEKEDNEAIQMMKLLYEHESMTRRDLETHDIGKKTIARLAKDYEKLFGNYRRDQKSIPPQEKKKTKTKGPEGYYIRDEYREIVSKHIEKLDQWVRKLVDFDELMKSSDADEQLKELARIFV